MSTLSPSILATISIVLTLSYINLNLVDFPAFSKGPKERAQGASWWTEGRGRFMSPWVHGRLMQMIYPCLFSQPYKWFLGVLTLWANQGSWGNGTWQLMMPVSKQANKEGNHKRMKASAGCPMERGTRSHEKSYKHLWVPNASGAPV